MPDATWNYTAGALSGAGTVARAGKCYGLSVTNASNSVAASFTINGGDTITLTAGQFKDFNTKGKLFDPIVTWVSGSLLIVIETLD